MNQIHYYLPLRGYGDDSLRRWQKAFSAASGASLLTVQRFWISLSFWSFPSLRSFLQDFTFESLREFEISRLWFETPSCKNFSFFWVKTPLKITFFESLDPKNLISKTKKWNKENSYRQRIGVGRKLKKWSSLWMNGTPLESTFVSDQNSFWLKTPLKITFIESLDPKNPDFKSEKIK